jgi:hypothetical protein
MILVDYYKLKPLWLRLPFRDLISVDKKCFYDPGYGAYYLDGEWVSDYIASETITRVLKRYEGNEGIRSKIFQFFKKNVRDKQALQEVTFHYRFGWENCQLMFEPASIYECF